MRICLAISAGLVSISSAQVPFCNLVWEVNDGSGWTRNGLVTTSRSVQARLIAEWELTGGRGFAGTEFDVATSSADAADGANTLHRNSSFQFIGQTLRAFRQGSIIKLDDSRDTDLPGAGAFWINCGQENGTFGTVDSDNPVSLFDFELTFGGAAGTRHIHSLHAVFSGHNANAAIYSATGSLVYVMASVQDVDVTYVPSPGFAGLVGAGSLIVLRRRRRCGC